MKIFAWGGPEAGDDFYYREAEMKWLVSHLQTRMQSFLY